jgi:hypothetical protein
MKKIIFCFLLLFYNINVYSIEYFAEPAEYSKKEVDKKHYVNFNNLIIKDSIDITKTKLYFITEEFIFNNWNSSKDVIQIKDLEKGVIYLKGTVSINYSDGLNSAPVYYSYRIKFEIKDYFYIMSIYDLKFDFVTYPYSNYSYVFIKILNEYESYFENNLSKKKFYNMQNSLHHKLNNLLVNYKITIKLYEINNKY